MLRMALGIALMVVGVGVSAVIFIALLGNPPPDVSTTILIALFCVLAPLLVFGGSGLWLTLRAYRARQQAQRDARQRDLENRLLALVNARGQISLGHAMAELQMSYEEGKAAIYGLVNAKRFPGYIDWDGITLYSAEFTNAAILKCPSCGGSRKFVGKGIVRCDNCGNQEFLDRRQNDAMG